jgi:DNA-binding CsgD family transcriptional regulator
MERDPLARLTEQQRTCLRLVYAHLTSKQIAPMMGIEPGSVDQHIKAAMRVLGAPDRRTAARMLADREGANTPQPLVYQPLDIVPEPDPVTLETSIGNGQQPYGRASDGAIRVEQATFQEEQASFKIVPFGGVPTLPFPIGGARPQDLNWLKRLGWIFAIMLVIALTFGVFVAGLEALSRIGGNGSF